MTATLLAALVLARRLGQRHKPARAKRSPSRRRAISSTPPTATPRSPRSTASAPRAARRPLLARRRARRRVAHQAEARRDRPGRLRLVASTTPVLDDASARGLDGAGHGHRARCRAGRPTARATHVTRPSPERVPHVRDRDRPSPSATRSTRWSIWNEPNQPQFLAPQYERGKPVSPKLYRKLYQAAVRGLRATPANATTRS